MKKLLLTSTLLFTSISCFKDYRKEMVTQQKKELNAAQNKISAFITTFVKTDIITKSEQLVAFANNSLRSGKIPSEKKTELEQAIKNLNHSKKSLESRIENAIEDLEISKNPNNGLKLLGSIYIVAKHEKIQDKVIEILNKIIENVEIALKINKEKKFLENTDMLNFQKLVPKCKMLIDALSSSNKNRNENEIKISSWISQIEQFKVLSNNREVEIKEELRNAMKSIIDEAEGAIKENNFIKLDELKEKKALPILEEVFCDFIEKGDALKDSEKLVLTEIGKNLLKPEAIMISKTSSIADEYIKVENLIKQANIEETKEWERIKDKYSFVIRSKAEIPSFEDAIEFQNYFKKAFEIKSDTLFNSLGDKINEINSIKLQKEISRSLNYLKIKLEDMEKKLANANEKTN